MRLERHCSLDRGMLKFSGMIPPSFANHPTPRQARDQPSSFPAARGFALGALVVISERDGNNSYFLRCRLAPFLPTLPPTAVIPRGKLRPYTTTRRETDTTVTAVYDTPSYFSLYVTALLVAPPNRPRICPFCLSIFIGGF
jgi:hypothetical protein